MSHYGYFYAIVSFSVIVSMLIMVPLLLRERPGEKLLPWTKGETSKAAEQIQLHSWKIIFKSLIKVFFLPVSFMMGMAAFSFSVGRGLIDTLLPVFTVQKLAWADTHYSQIFATATMISGIFGMFVGGFLVDYFGKVKMMSIYLFLLITIMLGMFFFKMYWQNEIFVTGFIISFYILLTSTTIAIFASAMQLCWKRISATQFTLYMAISNLGLATGAALMGQLKNVFEWEYIFLAYILFAAIMLVLIRFINFNNHQKRVDELELRTIEIDRELARK